MTDISPITRRLPTLAERGRCATPKYLVPTKADRARDKEKARRKDDRKLTQWARDVKRLDDWTDRYTLRFVKPVGRGVSVTHPDAGHAHHIEPRENWDVRYDVRNGITLSFTTHDKVERGKLRIVGTKFFTVNGRKYINGREPVKFEVVK
jgi:hypothetical protein